MSHVGGRVGVIKELVLAHLAFHVVLCLLALDFVQTTLDFGNASALVVQIVHLRCHEGIHRVESGLGFRVTADAVGTGNILLELFRCIARRRLMTFKKVRRLYKSIF